MLRGRALVPNPLLTKRRRRNPSMVMSTWSASTSSPEKTSTRTSRQSPSPSVRPTHKRTLSPPMPFDPPPVFQPLHPPKNMIPSNPGGARVRPGQRPWNWDRTPRLVEVSPPPATNLHIWTTTEQYFTQRTWCFGWTGSCSHLLPCSFEE